MILEFILYVVGWIIVGILTLSVKNNFHIIGDEDYPTSTWMFVVTVAVADFLLIIILLAFLCVKAL